MTVAARPVGPLIAANMLAAATLASIAFTLVGGLVQGGAVLDAVQYGVLLLVTLAVGWILTTRLPRHPVGWILIAVPALFTSTAPLDALGAAVPALSRWAAWYSGTDDDPSWSWLPPVWLLLVALPLHFPTGRLPSPRWRWFRRWAVADLVLTAFFLGTHESTVDRQGLSNPAYLPAVRALDPLYPVVQGLMAGTFLVCIASLFLRYSRAGAPERAQLRWILWAVALSVTGLIAANATPVGLALVESWGLLLYALIPIAVAIAVLRYRLYEIDRIMSRTAAYAIVTLVTVATYAIVVLGASALLGGSSPIAVALATLAAAGVFLPALRFVRRAVDRVFNRRQYDAERIVAAFGGRLRTADPHAARDGLITAVEQTLEPAAVGLWLSGGAR